MFFIALSWINSCFNSAASALRAGVDNWVVIKNHLASVSWGCIIYVTPSVHHFIPQTNHSLLILPQNAGMMDVNFLTSLLILVFILPVCMKCIKVILHVEVADGPKGFDSIQCLQTVSMIILPAEANCKCWNASKQALSLIVLTRNLTQMAVKIFYERFHRTWPLESIPSDFGRDAG